jgi:hypothetical protein
MPISLCLRELLGDAKINHVERVALLPHAHQEVGGLDVAVEDALGMDVLDAVDGLEGDEDDRFERELAVAVVEEVFERRAEEL